MSEPIFEASVRLRADVGDFEAQAQASIKDIVSRLETQTAQALQNAQRSIANAPPPSASAPVLTPPEPPPMPPIPALQVPVELIPPASAPPLPEIPPKEVPIELVPPASVPEITVPPVEVPPVPPIEVPVNIPPIEVPPVPPVQVPVAIDQRAIEQQLALAQNLAAAPLDIEVLANTKPFERDTAQAFAKAIALAEQQTLQLGDAAKAAAAESKAAFDSLLSGSGDRAAKTAAAQATLAVKTAANAAYEEAKTQLAKIQGLADEARLRPATELQTQAELAATKGRLAEATGDVVGQQAAELDAAVLGAQGAAESLALSAETLQAQAANVTGTEQQLLLAQAEEATLAAEKLRAEADRLRAAGPGAPPIVPGGPPQESSGSRFQELLRHETGGRTSGALGLLGGGLRFGLAGFAFTAAFESLRELQNVLKADGDEAFTTEGKIRNLGAELLGGNLIGGVKALFAQKPAEFIGGLKEALAALDEQKLALKESSISLEELANLQRGQQVSADKPFESRAGERYKVEVEGASDALEAFLKKQVEAGYISDQQAKDLAKVAEEFVKNEKSALDAAVANDAYAQSLQRAGNAAKLFGPEQGGPGGIAALQAAGGARNRDTEILFNQNIPPGTVIGQQRTGIPRPIIQPDLSVFRSEDPGNEIANQIRANITSRIKDDERRAQLEVRDAQIIEKQARAAFESAKKQAEINHQVNGAAVEWGKYQAAVTGVAEATAAAKTVTEQAAAEAAALDARIRDARVQRNTEPHALAQAELAAANEDLATAKKAFDARKSGTKAGKEARANYEEAVTAQVQAQAAVDALAKSDAETARTKAESAAATAKGAREAALANNITQNELEGDRAGTIKAFQAAISYWRTLAHQAGISDAAREEAQAQVLSLRGNLKSFREGGQTDFDPAQLRQQQLTNALTAAEQTGSIALQRRAAQSLVDFWREQKRGATGVERAQAEAGLLGARARRAQVDQLSDELELQRIQNRQATAHLNENLAGEKRAADDIVKYWHRKAQNLVGFERAQAVAQEIAAKEARKALNAAEDANGTGTTVFDLLTKTAERFSQFAGDLITPDQPFTRESFVGEQAQFFRPGVTPGDIVAGPTGFTADLGAFQERNERLGKIPGSGVEGSLDRNTQATDRLTDALLGVEGFGKHGYDDAGGGKVARQATGFAWSGGDFWKARQARQATEAGVGATRAGF